MDHPPHGPHTCPNCHKEIKPPEHPPKDGPHEPPHGPPKCPHCGKEFPKPKCPKCGAEIDLPHPPSWT